MKGGGIMGGNLEYNYSKLRGRIVEIFETQQNFAKEMGWSEHTLSSKLSNKVGWKQTDIAKTITLLKLKLEDIPTYFFNFKVQKM